MTVASDAIQCVNTPKTTAPAVSIASEAAQGLTMPEVAASMLCDIFQGVNTLHIASSAVFSAPDAAQRVTMPEIATSIASDIFQGVDTPKTAVSAASNATRPTVVEFRMHKIPASKLKTTLPGMQYLGDCQEGKNVRQIEQGQFEGRDVSGMWSLSDMAHAYLYDDKNNANRWTKGITTADASSLIKIPSGNPSVNYTQ